jgi:hypothetical protein
MSEARGLDYDRHVRPQLYLAYSILVLVVGVVLLLITGRAGIILIVGGLVGVLMNVTMLRRRR